MTDIDELARKLPELKIQLETAELDTTDLINKIMEIGEQVEKTIKANSYSYFTGLYELENVLSKMKYVEKRRSACLFCLRQITEIIFKDFAEDIEKIENSYQNGYLK